MKGVTGKLNRDRRARELAMIHVGKKNLGLDDGAYRAMLFTVAGQSSSAKLDATGRARVIERMKRDGAFADRAKAAGAPRAPNQDEGGSAAGAPRAPNQYKGGSAAGPFEAAWAEIRARLADYRLPKGKTHPSEPVREPRPYDDQKALYLSAWYWLGDNGHLWSEQWEAAGETSFVMRTAHVAHLQFCTAAQTNKLVEAVKTMIRRVLAKEAANGGL